MNNSLINPAPPQGAVPGAVVAVLAFLLPFLSLLTLWGVSACSFLIFLYALFYFKRTGAALARHWPALRWVVCAFLFNFLFALACFLLRPETHLGTVEKPSRMFFALSALALVLAFKPDRRALWWGVIAGAIAGLPLVAYQRLELAVDRPGGLINAITYGDLSLCLGLVALAAAIDFRGTPKMMLASAGAFAGILASIATGTRGGWVALALVSIVFVVYSHVLSSRRVRILIALSFALVAGTYFVPGTGVRERIGQGVHDVSTYFAGGSVFSNVGIRLELWKGATMLVAERPLAGRDLGAALERLAVYVKEGRLDRAVLDAPHFHNDALQALVTGGAIGLAAWLAILGAPFAFFARALRRQQHAGRQQFALALAGMLMVVCYFSFGLTEVIFWSVKGSLFYALMVFLLMGFCLNANSYQSAKAHDNAKARAAGPEPETVPEPMPAPGHERDPVKDLHGK